MDSNSDSDSIQKFNKISKINNDEDRQKEILYWSIENIKDYRYKELPVTPTKLRHFKELPKEQREKYAQSVMLEPDIVSYYKKYDLVKGENASNKHWLSQLLKWCDERDVISINKIKNALLTHGG